MYLGYLNFSIECLANFVLKQKSIQISGLEIYKENIKIKKITGSVEQIRSTFKLTLGQEQMQGANESAERPVYIKLEDSSIEDIDIVCSWKTDLCAQKTPAILLLQSGDKTIKANLDLKFKPFGKEARATANLLNGGSIETILSRSNNKQILSIHALKLPIEIIKFFLALDSTNAAASYLSSAFVRGVIDDANIVYNLTDEDFDGANGQIEMSDIAFNYNNQLPMIQNAKIIGALKEKSLVLRFQKGMVGSNTIEEAQVDIDTKNNVILINASLSGSVQSALDFAQPNTLKALADNGFTFSQIQGKASSKLNIVLPISIANDSSKTTQVSQVMNIQVQANNFSCSSDFLGLKSQKITAPHLSFTYQLNDKNDEISLESNFFLNQRSSYLKYQQKFDKGPISSILLAKIPLIESYLDNWASLNGDTHLVIEHTTFLDGKSRTRLQTDLTPVELTIPILGIKKEAKKPMYLSIIDDGLNGRNITKGKIQNNEKIYANFQINSQNGSITQISIPHFGYDAMFFNASIENNQDGKNIIITAKSLDFSKVDFRDILHRMRSGHGTNDVINIQAKQVLMNNSITLNNAELFYNKKEQNYLNFNASLGNSYALSIKHNPATQKVNAKCEDLGMFLRGCGLYQKLFRGAVAITYDYANPAKPVGKAYISSFYITENNFLTSIVSLTSMSGLMNIITRTKQIIFEKGEGDFEYKNNKLIIKNSLFSGPYMNFSAQGYVDDKEILIKGNVISEMYFTKTITEKIPGLNKLLGSIAPYRFQYSLHQ
ncbi:DUF3971 domain-containing protein [Rickettsiales endosymbiont of Paramecium tredecaurelia]|nr:DUF3971 domain-containing protein [Candidatus Sarmatiella mevalonica]